MSETEDLRIGRIFNADKAPDYVLFNGKLTIDDLNKISKYADANGEIKFDILRSKGGNPYMKINNWKPQSQYGGDDLPPAGDPTHDPINGHDDGISF
jgi:hypothetical protein